LSDQFAFELRTEDFDLRIVIHLESLGENNIRAVNEFIPDFFKGMVMIHILDECELVRRRNDGDMRSGLLMPVTVLAFMINVKTMLVMFDRGYAIAPAGQIENYFFQQSRLSGIGFSYDG